jgi:TonB-linked SusC/RagA family outer membrane protein
MRLAQLKYQTIRIAGLFSLCIFLAFPVKSQKAEGKEKPVLLNLKVSDEDGNPLPGVSVVVGEGILYDVTGQDGKLTFTALPGDLVSVSLKGYDKLVYLAGDLLQKEKIVLKKAGLYLSSDDEVPLPFMSLKKRHITSGSSVLFTEDLERYPSTDIRNSLTGLAPGLEVIEKSGSPGFSAEEGLGVLGITEKIAMVSRGRNVLYIIDEIPTETTEMPLDPHEIESVTVLKDIVAKAMFGPEAADGVVFIKTKRGNKNERSLKVNLESGISTVDRMPEWVDGAGYARLNNLARKNSGYTPLYSDQDIAAYAKSDPYDMFHPSISFREMMLKNSMAFRRANVSSGGGNDAVQYFSYLGYSGEGDIYKIGATSDYNRINTRSNIDIRINDFIKTQFNIYGGLTFRQSPNYGYDSDYTLETSDNPALNIIEFPSVIRDITTIPPVAFPIYANNDPALKAPWYAVSPSYTTNPYANLKENGYYTEMGRTGAASAALDFDLKSILKGLKSRTYVGFNIYNLLRVGKAEDYIAYQAAPSKTPAGADTILLTKVHDGVDQADQAKLHDYYFQKVAFYENLSYEKNFGKTWLQTALTYYLSRTTRDNLVQPQRQQNGIWTGLVSFNNTYSFQWALNYAGTSSLGEDNRYGLFPTAGISWVISEEDFMPDWKFLDYLKVRGEAGILGYENYMQPYYYRDNWVYTGGSTFGPYPTGTWFGTAGGDYVDRSYPARTGNPNLTWEKRKEFNAGLDASLFGHKLLFEVSYYNNLIDGQIITVQNYIPFVAGISNALPRFNFNKIRYFGVESGISYSDRIGNLKFMLGGNATIKNSKYIKFDEPAYRYAYQFHVGTSTDTYWGQTYLGKFASDGETKAVPQLFDEELHAGDLKYRDLNGDGFVDDNDRSPRGHTSPRLLYALRLQLSVFGFDLNLVGTGRAFYDIPLTNRYFWNGWGNNTYSDFVKDNVGGAYPRLTYNKVNNNFIASDFWLVKGGFFKLQNAELAYNIRINRSNLTGVRAARLFVRGANLLTFTNVKDIEPESIDSGVEDYPLFRTFTGGIKLTF